jgi:hypothetical protein
MSFEHVWRDVSENIKGINTQLIISTAGLENPLASPGLGQKGHENLGLGFHMRTPKFSGIDARIMHAN